MVTVVGMYICSGEDTKVIQLVGKDITKDSLSDTLEGVKILHTYNGSRFDLPFIHSCIGIDLARVFTHRDLMLDCWKNNLYGGLKAVERQLEVESVDRQRPGSRADFLTLCFLSHFLYLRQILNQERAIESIASEKTATLRSSKVIEPKDCQFPKVTLA